MVLAAIDNNAANQQAFLDHVNSVGTCRRGVCGRRTMGKLSAAWPLCTIPTLKVDNAEDCTVSTHQQYAPVGLAGSWYYFSALSVSVQSLVDVFLSLKSSLSTLMCVGLSARGSVWKMLKVREGHVLWSCHADCQTDSAPTTVTIRSWNRSSVLDTMYRSLRTFLPLWHKGLARVRTCKLQSQCTSGKSN